jgi:hypothetical protein
MIVTHDFKRRLFPLKDTVPDTIAFDTETGEFTYEGVTYSLFQITAALTALVTHDQIANNARTKRAKKRGGLIG